MSWLYEKVGKRALFSIDAERAHGISIQALKSGFHPKHDNHAFPELAIELAGLKFPNPLGMAAGYDKGADVPDALLSLGFGHTEIGTVTPLPQPGNPRPRIFRALTDGGVINRLGFNSEGHATVASRLRARNARNQFGIVGVNLGANKSSDDFAADYVKGIAAFSGLASYFTINISSPNTPGLRALQGADPLADLLARVSEARSTMVNPVPVFLKIAPDLSNQEMDEIAKALTKSDLDALIVSNTTLSREGVSDPQIATEAGGLSGRPLLERSTIVLARMSQRLDETVPLIGVGGVYDATTALNKIEAGASLVQLYSGLIYAGPSLPEKIQTGLARELSQRGVSLSDIIGAKTEDWAKRELK